MLPKTTLQAHTGEWESLRNTNVPGDRPACTVIDDLVSALPISRANRTTVPAHLSSKHPCRRAFYRLGTLIARHWLASIIFSVAVGVTLCYPSVFLYTNPTAGFTSKIPSHVWASARLFDNSLEKQPDLEIRQVWIHGSYMKALEHDVLKKALDIQSSLIRDGFDTSKDESIAKEESKEDRETTADGSASQHDSSEPLTWGFHSPLMYWNCSARLIKDDYDNAISAINEQSQRKSYMNLTLRPASVFAGKTFVNSNITAADALVVTFFDLADPATGAEWDRRLEALANKTATHHQWYLPEKEGSSHLYEFEFKPMTSHDALLLLLCYIFMTAYVLFNLTRLRAVRSTLGLGVAIITQLTVSIVASLTICGILNIDLSLIPREVYPFVVFAIGLDNMFRLMNAVFETPATMPTVQRIATAMSEVGHLSLASAGQNLLILWALSKVVAPSVQAFCAFAVIALIVDFIMHLSFFLAVLSVDVQRMELQDSLDRISLVSKRTKSPHRPERHTWYEALRHGRLPFSTRVAGTAIIISFVTALNWQFFDNMSLLQMLQTMRPGRKKAGILFSSTRLPPVNARRSPGAWLRMQDHQTAEEVMQFAKPKAPSFVARIHQPVAIVLHGADRGGVTPRTETVLAIIHDVLDAHLIPFALTVVVIVALTIILMSYLLWDELSEIDGFDGGDEEEESLHIGRLWRSHEHDVISISVTGRLIVAVSSDRLITATAWDGNRNSYTTQSIQTRPEQSPLWPVTAAAIDQTGTWLAVYSKNGHVGFCAVGQQHFKHMIPLPLQTGAAIVSTFAPPHATDKGEPQYLLLTSDGYLTVFTIGETVSIASSFVCTSALAAGVFVPNGKGQPRICALSRNGALMFFTRQDAVWQTSSSVEAGQANGVAKATNSTSLVRAAQLGCLVVVQSDKVRILGDADGKVAATVQLLRSVKKGSLRVLHPPRRECPKCYGPATNALILAFSDADTEECVLMTYELDGDTSLLCFSPADMRSNAGCNSIQNARVKIQTVENPGAWDATDLRSVIGIRKVSSAADDSIEMNGDQKATSTSSNSTLSSVLSSHIRLRQPAQSSTQSRSIHHESTRISSNSNGSSEGWEIWTLSSGGELERSPFSVDSIHSCQTAMVDHREHEQLYAAASGPVQKLGKRSVAIGLANTILVVTLGGGSKCFQDVGSTEFADLSDANTGWRSRGRDRDVAPARRSNN